jgi:hypothetical protein
MPLLYSVCEVNLWVQHQEGEEGWKGRRKGGRNKRKEAGKKIPYVPLLLVSGSY